MVEPRIAWIWIWRGGLVALVLLLGFLRLLPLGLHVEGLPAPDLIRALVLAWLVRRPDHLPAWLVVGLFLPLDLLLHGVPGLDAALMLLATEFLRARQDFLRNLPFVMEWLAIAAVLLVMAGLGQVVLMLFGLPGPALGPALLRALLTALAYPGMVLVAGAVLGLRKPALGEVDALGHRV